MSEFLGRERYKRRDERVSYRNGYELVTVKTTAGPLVLELTAAAQRVAARVRERDRRHKGVARTHALEAVRTA